MKNCFYLTLLLGTLLLGGCLKDDCTRTVTYLHYEPVWVTPEDFRARDLEVLTTRELEQPGQLYYYEDHIFINELNEGLHVIDNSEPQNPQPVAFLKIEGNRDLAIRDGILYANNYGDLLAIELGDLSDLNNLIVLSRTENMFPMQSNGNGMFLSHYETEMRTDEYDCTTANQFQRWGWGCPNCSFAEVDFAFDNSASVGTSVPSAPAGVGGSMARFTLYNGHLYTVDESTLRVFSLASPTAPAQSAEINLGWGIETIIPSGQYLFIGSNRGMQIFDAANPGVPSFVSDFEHAAACDPVFVKDEYAYVTLRSGNACEGFTDQLELIDISNIESPQLVRTFPMDNPHGLSIRENTLFLCEGESGLKTFDISDPLELDQHLLGRRDDGQATDVIVLPGEQPVVMVIGQDGFYQYDYSNPAELQLLSKISVE